MSIFFPLSLLILLSTGWFKRFPKDIGISRTSIFFGLAMLSYTSLLPTISIVNEFDIQLNFAVLLGIWLYLFRYVSFSRFFTIISLLIMLGSILFLYHEVARIQMDWSSPSFQWFIILFSIAEAILASELLVERICLVFGGLLLAECGILYLYHDRLSPIVLPGDSFLSTMWLTLFSLILIHYLLEKVSMWIKDRGSILWTKRR